MEKWVPECCNVVFQTCIWVSILSIITLAQIKTCCKRELKLQYSRNPNMSSGNDVTTLWNPFCAIILKPEVKFPGLKRVLRLEENSETKQNYYVRQKKVKQILKMKNVTGVNYTIKLKQLQSVFILWNGKRSLMAGFTTEHVVLPSNEY